MYPPRDDIRFKWLPLDRIHASGSVPEALLGDGCDKVFAEIWVPVRKDDAGEVVIFRCLHVGASARCDADWFVMAIGFVDEMDDVLVEFPLVICSATDDVE